MSWPTCEFIIIYRPLLPFDLHYCYTVKLYVKHFKMHLCLYIKMKHFCILLCQEHYFVLFGVHFGRIAFFLT